MSSLPGTVPDATGPPAGCSPGGLTPSSPRWLAPWPNLGIPTLAPGWGLRCLSGGSPTLAAGGSTPQLAGPHGDPRAPENLRRAQHPWDTPRSGAGDPTTTGGEMFWGACSVSDPLFGEILDDDAGGCARPALVPSASARGDPVMPPGCRHPPTPPSNPPEQHSEAGQCSAVYFSRLKSHVHAVGWGCSGARGGGACPGPRASLRLLSSSPPSLPLTHSSSLPCPPTGFLSAHPARPSLRSLLLPGTPCMGWGPGAALSPSGLPLGQGGGNMGWVHPSLSPSPAPLRPPQEKRQLRGGRRCRHGETGPAPAGPTPSLCPVWEGAAGRGGIQNPLLGPSGSPASWPRPPPAPPTPSCLSPPSLAAAPRPGPDPDAGCQAAKRCEAEGESPGV